MDEKIASMYAKQKRSYFGRYGMDVLITAVSMVVLMGSMVRTSYAAFLKDAKANWADNKCNPVYMPFAGSIAPQVGQSAFDTTTQNFTYCVHHNISAAIGLLLMPLEFVNFLILTSLDLLIKAMIEAIKLFAYLASLLKKAGLDVNKKLSAFLVPITVLMVKMRDAIAKGASLMLISVYTTFTIYNIVVGSLLSIMNIVLNILILLSALIAAMMAAGSLLTAFLVTAPAGIALIIAATALLLIVFTPTLVLYLLLQPFMLDIFGAKARAVPFG